MTQKHMLNTYTQGSKHHTQGVVRLQVLVGQFEEALDSLQRNFGLQDAIEHPGKRIEWDDQHSHQRQRGKHLQGRRTMTTVSEPHCVTQQPAIKRNRLQKSSRKSMQNTAFC